MLRKLSKSRFVRNVAVLSSGQAIAQALAIAASPILTRLYEPDAFGAFGLLIALSAALSTIAGLRYELAIVTAKHDTAAANLLVLSCSIVVVVSGLVALTIGLAGDWLALVVKQPGFGEILWWLPVLLLIGGIYSSLSYWSIRKTRYKRIAISRVLNSIMTLGSQTILGILSIGSGGLLGGRAAGSVTAAGIMAAQIFRSDELSIKSMVNRNEIIRAARQNSRFPKYNAPHSFINTLARTALIPYTLAPFFGVEVVGFYYLADRVLRTPSALVSGSVRGVFFQRASELYNKGKSFYRLLFRTVASLCGIGISPVMLIVLFGPEIFSFVFGAEWREAGTLTQWLACWWFLGFITGPAVETLTILRMQKYLLLFQIAFSLSSVAAIVIGAMMGDYVLAIAACSIVGVVFNLFLLTTTLLILRTKSASEG